MPPAKQPDDASAKRRRRESDEAGPIESSSDDAEARASPHAPPPPPRTRSAVRKTATKRAKPTTDDVSSAPDPGELSTENDDAEKTDGVPEPEAASDAVSRSSSTTFTGRRAARLEEKYGDLSTQESLDARAAKWTSHVYKHFRPPVLATNKQGALTSRFVCIKNPSKHVDHTLTDESTENLHRHIQVCTPLPPTDTKEITEYAQGVNYSYARLRIPEFRELLRMLYARVEIPSRVTVSRDVKDIFEDSRARVKAKLQALPGKIHICMDGWMSPNVISFLGVTAHWHENGSIQHVILDFIKLTKGHTGAYLAAKLMELLDEFGIVLGVTCDNASNNAKMLKEMKKLNPEFRGSDACVRCFGHVINLVVKVHLSALDDPEDVEDDDDDDDDEVDEAREAADHADIEEDEGEINKRPELVVAEDEQKLARLTLQKIIKLSQKVWNSPTVRDEMSRQAKDAGKKSEVLIRAVRTRWNTVTMVLARALDLRPILFGVCDKAEFNKSQGVRLRRFIIEDEDWPILEQLHELLAVFLEATMAISHSSTPLLHDVIPWIDVMTHHLEDTRDNIEKLPIKYYKHTDETPFYRVAILLHPCYKKRYFARARWPRGWVEASLRLIRAEWENHYRNHGDPANEEDQTGPQRDGEPSHGASKARESAGRAARDMLASLTGADELEEEDTLEEYLEAPLRTKQTDPLKYWHNALVNGTANPGLAQMALDILSIPDQSVRASTVLGSWARYSDLVPEAEAVELLRSKEKGKRKVAAAASDATVSEPGRDVITLSD
ncbi:hypothetical protein GSI_08362 [Ganoderma sinense ZZ0214-1]|uniref:HAT C-terminal dimerisation domain-containing protein n=1 Tax=Ganoderma sinense ZZ0214-1 TaxID=1077348 RepID=A0A2G8S742_9APHY|nr:hypothetical protein GSI_08362 [Ganoderma sinense ZZ0214-1]